MQSRAPAGHRLPGVVFRSRISAVMLAMFATMASVYVAGRLWQDSENRVFLITEIDRRTGQGQSAVTVDDNLKILACSNGTHHGERLLAVIGIFTGFGRRKNRDAIRKSWVQKGAALKKMEKEKGILLRFVIGRSTNQGDGLDRAIEDENKLTNDFLILDNQIEAPEEVAKKIKLFFSHAADTWDAEFYAKVNDDIHVNLDSLTTMLSPHLDQPRVYIGCMKSGEVFSDSKHKWYEPDWWKFGDGKSYFRHASGEFFILSELCTAYAHDDISVGSWLIGLDVKHINEGKLCCSSWSTGAICSTVL
ncbi:unnamed protein product [Spirodela intermedia]|uniref:Hexosyltransferase n=1 Tax=Spirodela intermedia TaxID=51605 RepID=A0A7I8ISP0_SPIIN|nr:unnamed protein product [Spirodela intermedia]CAA6661030.1 unnamed protein product [Spirodela intermedia]